MHIAIITNLYNDNARAEIFRDGESMDEMNEKLDEDLHNAETYVILTGAKFKELYEGHKAEL